MSSLLTKFFITIFFLFLSPVVFSQVLKIENGINVSTINAQKVDILDKPITTYSLLLGLDYLERKNFYLSSELGYLKKGGKEKNEFLPDEFKNIKESWSYIHLNTTIRYPLRIKDNAHFFIGAGPNLDILIDSKEFKSPLYEGYDLNSTIFGVKGEIGFVKDFQKIRLGLNFAYLYDISKSGETEFTSFKNNAFQLMFSVGYLME